MPKISRAQFVERLQNNWAGYITQFNRLSPQQQKLFLNQQGYARLADLLAHITAWWTDGAASIERMRSDPLLPNPDYDVDAFNASAVQKAAGLSESAVIQAYQAQLHVMLALLDSLSDAQLEAENINTRLYYEIIMHWSEHEIDADIQF